MDRRAEDPRITQLTHDVHALKEGLAKNNETTEQVRDILASFRVVGAVAKWLSGIGAAAVMAYHGWQKVTGR